MGGRFAPEWVATFSRIGGRFAPESTEIKKSPGNWRKCYLRRLPKRK